jgi:Uma2 family endonuclease
MVITKETRFTRADYMRLPEGLRAELIGGDLVKEPSPTLWHQVLVGRIYRDLAALVGTRRVVPAPIDIFVDDESVLQPDVAVLPESAPARPDAPETPVPVLVVEVLSPSTRSRDRHRKPPIYFQAGVREVWIVDPDAKTAEILTPGGSVRFTSAEIPRSGAVPGLSLDLETLFTV